MRQQRIILLAASAAMLQILMTGSAFAACNWEADAVAGMDFGGTGVVKSSHFGRFTRVDCSTNLITTLQPRALKDGAEVWVTHIDGPPATLGAYIGPEEFDFSACSGGWSSTTRFGTKSKDGSRFWHASDVSAIYLADCSPLGGDDGGCGGQPCEDGCS